MRQTNFFTFNNEEAFKNYCVQTADTLINKYNFFYGETCNEIKGIITLVKSKKDNYTHRLAVYYIKDECYFVLYRKNDISVQVLTGCNGCQIAHYLVGKFKKINELKAIQKEKEFDEMIKQQAK